MILLEELYFVQLSFTLSAQLPSNLSQECDAAIFFHYTYFILHNTITTEDEGLKQIGFFDVGQVTNPDLIHFILYRLNTQLKMNSFIVTQSEKLTWVCIIQEL